MIVQDVIDFAKAGECKQLAVAVSVPGDTYYEADQIALLGFVNLGLIDIYTRFALKRVTQTVATVVDGTSVVMGDDYLFLQYACGTNDDETEIPINNEFATFSVFENEPYTISFKRDDTLNTEIVGVNLTYIASPTLLTDEDSTVPLTYQFIEPLLLYMAYKAHSSVTASTDADNNVYFQRYMASVQMLKRSGALIPDNQSNYKLSYKGFC